MQIIKLKAFAEFICTYHSAEEYELKKQFIKTDKTDVAVDADGFQLPKWPNETNVIYPVHIYKPLT